MYGGGVCCLLFMYTSVHSEVNIVHRTRIHHRRLHLLGFFNRLQQYPGREEEEELPCTRVPREKFIR